MLLQFLTLISGRNLKDYVTKSTTDTNPLGDLSIYQTHDGSISLHSSIYKEGFHCSSGAKQEAIQKFMLPAELERYIPSSTVHILDVCMGMGYNSACIIEKLFSKSVNVQWWGLEIDKRPINIAVTNPIFKLSWPISIQELFTSLDQNSYWENKGSKGKMLWGDARIKLKYIPNYTFFDLILLDAFSPSKCPMLWTEEFIGQLSKKLKPNGRLITYSSAAAIRESLKRSGLNVYSQIPLKNANRQWSNGTTAIRSTNRSIHFKSYESLQPLTTMEEEHLYTRAAVPYRDPSGEGTNREILNRREIEQKNSKLEDTNQWKRRWEKAQQETSR